MGSVKQELATKDQFFQYNGELYEQKDGVGMGSSLGPLMANAFLCHIEEHLDLPVYDRRYVDDTITVMSCESAAHVFLDELNSIHPSLHFTIEKKNYLSLECFLIRMLLGYQPVFTENQPTKSHYYTTRVTWTIVIRLVCLRPCLTAPIGCPQVSNYSLMSAESSKNIFKRLKYPEDLINRTVKNFVDSVQSGAQKPPQAPSQAEKTFRIVLPYKDQKSANVLRSDSKI